MQKLARLYEEACGASEIPLDGVGRGIADYSKLFASHQDIGGFRRLDEPCHFERVQVREDAENYNPAGYRQQSRLWWR